MARLPDNIEKSGFRTGEYVGYGGGAWRIRRRMGGGWVAIEVDGLRSKRGATLWDIGVFLKSLRTVL